MLPIKPTLLSRRFTATLGTGITLAVFSSVVMMYLVLSSARVYG